MSPALPGRLCLLAVLAGVAGCSDAALHTSDAGALADTGMDELAAEDGLRLDIFPSDATPGLRPQSVYLDPATDWTGLDVAVSPSVTLSGQVLGFVANPVSSNPTVPGQEDQPIAARIDVVMPDSVAGGSTTTAEDGRFEVQVPPGMNYRIDLVPEQTDRVPFDTMTIPVLASDLDLGIWTLDYGVPVWGRVTYSDDSVPRGATVQLIDATWGTPGPHTTIDSDGWYMLRAYPGDYTLVVEGRTGGSDPTITRPVTVEGTADDLRVDMDVGPSARATLSGTLVDGQGFGLASDRNNEYRVVATAVDLRDVTGTLTVERTTAAGGAFELSLPAGDWRLDAIPPYDAGLSPTSLDLTISEANLDIGELVLPTSTGIDVLVRTTDGQPAPGVLVVARETGFDGYTYSATTDAAGIASFDVPRVRLELTATPPTDSAAITRTVIDAAEVQDPTIDLIRGVPVSGSVVAQGEPVSYALVEVRDARGELYGTAITDGDGAFSMRVPLSPSTVTP
ncbi:MAG: hypothetical protein D6798_20830 [Deltaproteobacteria bacterium]|nr:MAG: hypothetical protein D6798_20830 [Deltaproteobacteria bacterium]